MKNPEHDVPLSAASRESRASRPWSDVGLSCDAHPRQCCSAISWRPRLARLTPSAYGWVVALARDEISRNTDEETRTAAHPVSDRSVRRVQIVVVVRDGD